MTFRQLIIVAIITFGCLMGAYHLYKRLPMCGHAGAIEMCRSIP